ncbi:uncharacterized protein BXZ73DRAFT_75409 [Epithele typhae]|uniref:uncharacterized protein n=1 Tax=Epithele typhae TaxID=378194 RepID=UPI00200735CF|nr:uncharacterized protein BXZ73DRAFT_75409 [Epithele typhae]KAH9940883.1 hypothetical protein BXZ73DRAFT_75409 [Epithele typhae]
MSSFVTEGAWFAGRSGPLVEKHTGVNGPDTEFASSKVHPKGLFALAPAAHLMCGLTETRAQSSSPWNDFGIPPPHASAECVVAGPLDVGVVRVEVEMVDAHVTGVVFSSLLPVADMLRGAGFIDDRAGGGGRATAEMDARRRCTDGCRAHGGAHMCIPEGAQRQDRRDVFGASAWRTGRYRDSAGHRGESWAEREGGDGKRVIGACGAWSCIAHQLEFMHFLLQVASSYAYVSDLSPILNGMFSFVLFDQSVLLPRIARDPIGNLGSQPSTRTGPRRARHPPIFATFSPGDIFDSCGRLDNALLPPGLMRFRRDRTKVNEVARKRLMSELDSSLIASVAARETKKVVQARRRRVQEARSGPQRLVRTVSIKRLRFSSSCFSILITLGCDEWVLINRS